MAQANRQNITRTLLSQSISKARKSSATRNAPPRMRRTKLDPVFEAIAAHQIAHEAHLRAIDALEIAETRHQDAQRFARKAQLAKTSRAVAAAEAEEAKAVAAEVTALKKLCRTAPKTPLGFTTWVGYLRPRMNEDLRGLYYNGATDRLWDTLHSAAYRVMHATRK